jgi:nitroimidazol reductase NimA-like FMN-containing flavoprotein (pyridoxamine 5'-phosphate oxidase superfamily)
MAMDESVMDALSPEECIELLEATSVGRIGVVLGGAPMVLPVNYKWISDAHTPYLAVRTRPGNVIDRASPEVAFEIDGIDAFHRVGWSVLVRGMLHHLGQPTVAREVLDPHPWLQAERDSWLLIEPKSITGRRLRAVEIEWAFYVEGYL